MNALRALPNRLRTALVLTVLAIGLVSRATATSDEEILAKMQQRVSELNQQILQAGDLTERLALQKKLVATIDEALQAVSPQIRPMLEVGLKIVQPLQIDAAAYMKSANEFFTGGGLDFRTIKVRQDIAKRAADIAALKHANQQLLVRIDSIEDDSIKMLEKAEVPKLARDGFMEGLRETALKKIGALRAMRSIDDKTYSQCEAAFALLDEQWGKWHADSAVKIKFEESEAQAKFSTIFTEVQRLGQRSRQAEEAALAKP